MLQISAVGCGKGVVYLTSPGHPTDIGLQLGKVGYWPRPLAEFRRVSMRHLLHWSGQQQHLLQRLQALGAQEMQWAQALDKGP